MIIVIIPSKAKNQTWIEFSIDNQIKGLGSLLFSRQWFASFQ